MATGKIVLGFFCLIALGSSWGTERRNLTQDPRQEAYQRVLTAAQKEVGVREGRVANTGTRVSEYLRYVGFKTPQPWCAAWVSYVFKQAGFGAPRTAWSPALFPQSRQVREPAPGVVFGIYYAALGRVGHCGVVERLAGDWVYSIEGNTGSRNERDGDGVWRKLRHRRSIRCYADWLKGQVL